MPTVQTVHNYRHACVNGLLSVMAAHVMTAWDIAWRTCGRTGATGDHRPSLLRWRSVRHGIAPLRMVDMFIVRTPSTAHRLRATALQRCR